MKSHEIIELAQVLDQNKTEIQNLVNNTIENYGPVIYQILERSHLGLADLQTAYFNKLIDNGFDRQEAFHLLISTNERLINAAKANNNSGK